MADALKYKNVYGTQKQNFPVAGLTYTYDVRNTVVSFKNTSGVIKQPKGLRYLHAPYSVTGRTDQAVTMFHTVKQRDYAGRVSLIETFTGVHNRLSYYENVVFAGTGIDVPTRHLNLAELQMFSNMTDAKVELLTMFAELSKTANVVIDPLNQLYNAVRSARRGRWSDVLKHLKIERHNWRANARNAGGRWLEVSFGWLPLIEDIRGLIDVSNGLITKPLDIAVKGASIERLSNINASKNGYSHTVQHNGYCGYRCSVVARARSDFFLAAKAVNLHSPASTLWEIAPWSFLIDYVTPIGDWLGALSAPMGFHFVTGSRTGFFKSTVTERYLRSVFPGSTEGLIQSAVTYDSFWMSRAVYSDFPTPSLGLKNPLSSLKRGVNIASLLIQQLKQMR